MEFTVQFTKATYHTDKEILLETTICETDMTRLKREVTKLSKTLDEFRQLQEACPISWETYGPGYDKGHHFSKRWTDYTKGYPFDEDFIYTIKVFPTAHRFEEADKKLYSVYYNVDKAYQELTGRTRKWDPQISDLDPDLAEIIGISIPERLDAFLELIEAAQERLKDKVKELNNRE